MNLGFLNLVVLLGLVAVVIPPLIHLLNRRRHNTVDWGAMQFLQIKETKRKRLLIEELLLMLLRMGLIALLVMALAGPVVWGSLVARLGNQPNRDVVLIFDGSYSMDENDGKKPTAHESAKTWAASILNGLSSGDRVAVLHAKHRPISITKDWTGDVAHAKDLVENMPKPDGYSNGPAALIHALELLDASANHAQRDIVVLTDGQRFGWSDQASLQQWKKLISWFRTATGENAERITRIWFVDANSRRAKSARKGNYQLAVSRDILTQGWVGQTMTFKFDLIARGVVPARLPFRLRVEIDGVFEQYLSMPGSTELKRRAIPLHYSHIFEKAGSHVVSLVLEAPGSVKKSIADALRADNRVDVAVVVQESLPVLLVDGDKNLSSKSSTFFLRNSFAAPRKERGAPRVIAHTVTFKDFARRLLRKPLPAQKKGDRPKVVILADIPKLSSEQSQAIEEFLAARGGVWIILGKRVENAAAYNDALHRMGKGWLPAVLDKIQGGDKDVTASPDVREFHHPALEIFQKQSDCTLDSAKVSRWWRVKADQASGATIPASLTTGDPFLVERGYKKGKVLLTTTPLDGSWNSTLPRTWEFPVLVHELVYYLADAGDTNHNVKTGEPLRYQPKSLSGKNKAAAHTVRIHFPSKLEQEHKIRTWPFVFTDTNTPGIYRIKADNKPDVQYVVHIDRRESDLSPMSKEERKQLEDLTGGRFTDNPRDVWFAAMDVNRREYLWWLVLIGVIALLCTEIWMTRRMVKRREGS